jgi:hypothetical protein
MSVELQLTKDMRDRSLRHDEYLIIEVMLRKQGLWDTCSNSLNNSRVKDMEDGGMGSIRFEPSKSRRYGRTLAEAQYTDGDGVLVSITLNADTDGNLFEMDFWKVDFCPLVRYPQPCDLEFKKFGV